MKNINVELKDGIIKCQGEYGFVLTMDDYMEEVSDFFFKIVEKHLNQTMLYKHEADTVAQTFFEKFVKRLMEYGENEMFTFYSDKGYKELIAKNEIDLEKFKETFSSKGELNIYYKYEEDKLIALIVDERKRLIYRFLELDVNNDLFPYRSKEKQEILYKTLMDFAYVCCSLLEYMVRFTNYKFNNKFDCLEDVREYVRNRVLLPYLLAHSKEFVINGKPMKVRCTLNYANSIIDRKYGEEDGKTCLCSD